MKELLIQIRRKLNLIGYYEYWDYRKKVWESKGLKSGDNVTIVDSSMDSGFLKLISIGNNVLITGSTILAHDASTNKFLGYTKCGAVTIGDNVFIGYGCIILPNTHIGNDVIVGAGSVVRGTIPDDSIVIGNPAQVVSKTSKYLNKYSDLLTKDNIYEKQNIDAILSRGENTVGFVR